MISMHTIKYISLIFVFLVTNCSCLDTKNTTNPELYKNETMPNIEVLKKVYNDLKKNYIVQSKKVIQPAEGYLEYPYLIPAGFYKQMWDWDGFFMGNYFVSKGHPEYLKYWALNLIKGIDDEGYVSGCATTEGPRPIFGKFAMKPFLSQGVYLASKGLNDFSWVKPHYKQLKKVLA